MGIKLNDARERLRKAECHPQLRYVIEAIIEEQAVQRQICVTIAQNVDQMADIIRNFTHVATNMKQTVERMRGSHIGDNDEPIPSN